MAPLPAVSEDEINEIVHRLLSGEDVQPKETTNCVQPEHPAITVPAVQEKANDSAVSAVDTTAASAKQEQVSARAALLDDETRDLITTLVTTALQGLAETSPKSGSVTAQKIFEMVLGYIEKAKTGAMIALETVYSKMAPADTRLERQRNAAKFLAQNIVTNAANKCPKVAMPIQQTAMNAPQLVPAASQDTLTFPGWDKTFRGNEDVTIPLELKFAHGNAAVPKNVDCVSYLPKAAPNEVTPLLDSSVYYDDHSTIAILAMAYDRNDKRVGKSQLRKFNKNFSSKDTVRNDHVPVGEPAFIRHPERGDFYIAAYEKFAYWGYDASNKLPYSYRRDYTTVDNVPITQTPAGARPSHVLSAILMPPADVKASAKPLTGLDPALFTTATAHTFRIGSTACTQEKRKHGGDNDESPQPKKKLTMSSLNDRTAALEQTVAMLMERISEGTAPPNAGASEENDGNSEQ